MQKLYTKVLISVNSYPQNPGQSLLLFLETLPQDRLRKFNMIRLPICVRKDSGWNWIP